MNKHTNRAVKTVLATLVFIISGLVFVGTNGAAHTHSISEIQFYIQLVISSICVVASALYIEFWGC